MHEPINGKKQLRILVMEDDRIVRFVTSKVIEKMGHIAIQAENGAQGIKRFKESMDFSLVVTDFEMPIMDGMAALMELRAIDPDVKVIVLSGYSGDYEPEDFIKAGAKAFILKPVDNKVLMDLIEKTINGV